MNIGSIELILLDLQHLIDESLGFIESYERHVKRPPHGATRQLHSSKRSDMSTLRKRAHQFMHLVIELRKTISDQNNNHDAKYRPIGFGDTFVHKHDTFHRAASRRIDALAHRIKSNPLVANDIMRIYVDLVHKIRLGVLELVNYFDTTEWTITGVLDILDKLVGLCADYLPIFEKLAEHLDSIDRTDNDDDDDEHIHTESEDERYGRRRRRHPHQRKQVQHTAPPPPPPPTPKTRASIEPPTWISSCILVALVLTVSTFFTLVLVVTFIFYMRGSYLLGLLLREPGSNNNNNNNANNARVQRNIQLLPDVLDHMFMLASPDRLRQQQHRQQLEHYAYVANSVYFYLTLFHLVCACASLYLLFEFLARKYLLCFVVAKK